MKRVLTFVFFIILFALIHVSIYPHCEIPCGIYNDEMRFTMMEENIQTIEKAIQQIMQLSKESPQNMNQIVRWIMNKEKHAEEIQHIVSQYFLTQRIKSADSKNKKALDQYVKRLTSCHKILIFAMKTKQTTDLENVQMLKMAVESFKKAYFVAK